MKYLNFDILHKIDARRYQRNKPFPFIDVPNALHEDAYKLLVQSAPDVSLFEKQFGIERSHGQKFHDKYFLLYSETVPLSPAWKEFVAELFSDEYQDLISSMFNVRKNSYDIVLSWHYMPRGTCITPHCDTKKKIGSQLFYLNTTDTWNHEWGGQTLALDDNGEKNPMSGPQISEFSGIFTSKSIDNNSFIFTRTEHSWHAVEEIKCPENELRKMFSFVANKKLTVHDKFSTRINRLLRKVTD